jgi:hypothetical protein
VIARILAIVLSASACGPIMQPPDSLRIIRESAVAGNVFPPLDRTIAGRAAEDLWTELMALPPKTVDRFCANDSGTRYRLSFNSSPTLKALLEAGGCRYAYLTPTDVRETTEDFWAHLAGALGFYTRGNDLFPTPMPRESPTRAP